jgi:hypothetical protein
MYTKLVVKRNNLFPYRIRTELRGGAWCPKAQIAKDVYEYLQIDLGSVKVVTLVETQGRFGNGQVSSLSLTTSTL